MENIADFVNADGTVVEGANLHTLAGEEYGESKALENVTSLEQLVKVAIDSKAEAKRKLENVIQRPAQDADEATIQTFRNSLMTEAGLTFATKPEDYNLQRPANIPEGLIYDEELEKYYRNLFFESKVPKEIAEKIFNTEAQRMIETHIKEIEAAKQVHDAKVADLKIKYPGDELTKFARIAHDALMAFGSEDIIKDGQTIKGLKSQIKDAKLYDNPTDFDAWLKIGIDTDTLGLWYNIGQKMQAGGLQGGNQFKQKEVNADVAFINKVNAQTPEFQIKE